MMPVPPLKHSFLPLTCLIFVAGLSPFAMGEADISLTGELSFVAYGDPDLDPTYGTEAELFFTADELSRTSYQFGTFLDVKNRQTVQDIEDFNSEKFSIERYGLYFGIAEYQSTFANKLTLDQAPETHFSVGEGIITQWTGVQPLEGAKAYTGQFSDLTQEGNGGLELSADWSIIALRLGATSGKFAEFATDLRFDFGSFHYACSPLVGAAGHTQAFGMAFEFGFTSLDFAFGMSDTNDQQTGGFKLTQEFATFTLGVSLGGDEDGKTTGYSQASGLSVDAFVGDAGLVSVAVSALETAAKDEEQRGVVSYNHEIESLQIIASYAQHLGTTDTDMAEIGIKYTF